VLYDIPKTNLCILCLEVFVLNKHTYTDEISYSSINLLCPFQTSRTLFFTMKCIDNKIQKHSSPLCPPSDANLLYLLGAAMALTILHYTPKFHATKTTLFKVYLWASQQGINWCPPQFTSRTAVILLPDIDHILSSIWLSICLSL
jgi:hypothetical protein